MRKTKSKSKRIRKQVPRKPDISTEKPTNGAVTKSRRIDPKTTLFLYVRAGGICEFDGCNTYLLQHDSTYTPGNFAEQAHIYAFKVRGPRGHAEGRPSDINGIDNLLLLCPACHHLVDSVDPDRYTADVLRKFKKDHEDRIFRLTTLVKNRDTVPVVLKGLIAGRAMDVSDDEMQTAVAPDFLRHMDKIEIDLSAIPDSSSDSFFKSACAAIDRAADRIERLSPREGRTLRLSIFALAPIPLLVYLGAKLSDKRDMEFYLRRRNPESWVWKEGYGEAQFRSERSLDSGDQVALLVNVSGQTSIADIIPTLGNCKVYTLSLDREDRSPLAIQTRDDLGRFIEHYIQVLSTIRADNPDLERLHIFPAVPAPAALALGRFRLPKVDPTFVLYDRDKSAGGFIETITLG